MLTAAPVTDLGVRQRPRSGSLCSEPTLNPCELGSKKREADGKRSQRGGLVLLNGYHDDNHAQGECEEHLIEHGLIGHISWLARSRGAHTYLSDANAVTWRAVDIQATRQQSLEYTSCSHRAEELGDAEEDKPQGCDDFEEDQSESDVWVEGCSGSTEEDPDRQRQSHSHRSRSHE